MDLYLKFTSSAPEEVPPPPPGNKNGIGSDIRLEITKNRAEVSEIRRDVADTRTMVSYIHSNMPKRGEEASGRGRSVSVTDSLSTAEALTLLVGPKNVSSLICVSAFYLISVPSLPGESPPPAPNVCFGRDQLVEEIVGFAERLTSVALIGVGGIGKTYIARNVLNNDRIKQRFGDDRRFIRCDKFPASLTHFLRRLSEVIGAGIKNPEDLTPLRPSLSSREMIIVLDNAESILDPRVADAQEIYEAVEELSNFSNISLCITSRISTIPPGCKSIEVPTLSMEPARDTFYHICEHFERSESVDDILERLAFHPLSIALLATVALHSKWSIDRVKTEWEERRTGVLETEHNRSLAATIELSLTSPMFRELGPDARGLLGVVAFFPQGIDENNFEWLFPTISNRATIFDKFCILSLTHRSNGFITMLAPLRDYLSPKNLTSSSLLCVAGESYFARLSVEVDPDKPGFEDTRWITSEDVNVEQLLDVSMSANASSESVCNACANFMQHIFWHKKRLVVFGPKVEALPDDHPSKPRCLSELSQLFRSVGDHTGNKRTLNVALRLWRRLGDGYRVVQSLMFLAYTNRVLSFHEEALSQAKEASEICERLNITSMQAHSLRCLAWMLRDDNQLDAAGEAASRAIDRFKENEDRYGACLTYRVLGTIYHRKGKIDEAISQFKTALEIASTCNFPRELFWNYYCLAEVFFDEERFDEAHTHVELAKSHWGGDSFNLGRGMQLQAEFLHKRGKSEEAKAEVLKAIEVYEGIGTTLDLEKSRGLLLDIQKELDETAATAHESNGDGEFLGVAYSYGY